MTEKLREDQFTEVEAKPEQNQEELLLRAIQNTTFAMIDYYNKNKNSISKNELFKVLVAAAIFPVEVPFPEEALPVLYNPETASEVQKNFMAFATHLFDINQNLRLRKIATEVAMTQFEEEKK